MKKACCLFLIFASASCSQTKPDSYASSSPPEQKPTISETNMIGIARALSSTMADTVEKVMPSVVMIQTESTTHHYYRDFFYLYEVPERRQGLGSGVILSRDGYILTNNHVVDQADNAYVVLQNGLRYKARIIGKYPSCDIAVLKIVPEKNESFTPIEPGDSDEIRVGEFVLAIGSPFSLQSTVTQGIISQKWRINKDLPLVDFLQTSASINPGNSGGPLVDLNGRLIGINTYIHTGSRYSQGNIGIGFAIPSNLALDIAKQFMEGKKARIKWIGVSIHEYKGTGVLIKDVMRNSPAEKGGIESGDVILEIDGKPINSFGALRGKIYNTSVGVKFRVKLLRNKTEIEREIKVEYQPNWERFLR